MRGPGTQTKGRKTQPHKKERKEGQANLTPDQKPVVVPAIAVRQAIFPPAYKMGVGEGSVKEWRK